MNELVINSSDPRDAVRLIEQLAAAVAQTVAGWTPLHSAGELGNCEAARLILAKGASINTPDQDGDTALHMAAQEGHLPVVELLIERGADISAANIHGGTALHRAAYHGHTTIVMCLLTHGARRDVLTKQGSSALQMAEACGHTATASLLRSASAPPSGFGEDGRKIQREHETVRESLDVAPKPVVAESALRAFARHGAMFEPVRTYSPKQQNPFFDLDFDRRVKAASARGFKWKFWSISTIKRPSDLAAAIRNSPQLTHRLTGDMARLPLLYAAVDRLLSDEKITQRLRAQCASCATGVSGEELTMLSLIPVLLYHNTSPEQRAYLEGRCAKCGSKRVFLEWTGENR
jgi:hypothetical protein